MPACNNLASFLTSRLKFRADEYDRYVANKIINQKDGKKMKITSNQDKIHQYVGVTIDISESNNLIFRMYDYIYKAIEEFPGSMKGVSAIPSSPNNLEVNLWACYFLLAQGYTMSASMLYQDNQSSILLEENEKASSTKQTRHIHVRYFFITDCVERGEINIEYMPSEDVIGDFFTKGLTGSQFKLMRNSILNIKEQNFHVYPGTTTT